MYKKRIADELLKEWIESIGFVVYTAGTIVIRS
jgi:hypothetical protein